MSDGACSLNGKACLRASLVIPRAGSWTAMAQVADVFDTSGPAKFTFADLECTGTIVNGGPHATRGWYLIVGGKNGWTQPLKPKSYRSEAGVKASSILGDAAAELGETMGAFPDFRVGPAYVRPPSFDGDATACEGARLLDAIAKDGWYVDLDGKTYVGKRAAKTFSTKYRFLDGRPDLRRVTISCEELAGLVPGAKLEGLEAADVRHELTETTLRTHVYGAFGKDPMSRAWQAIARIARAVTLPYLYTGRFEFQVTGGSGGYVDVQPMNRSLGLPALGNVPMRTGIMGGRGTPAKGSTVLVGFMNFDPTRPYADSYGGETSPSSVPTESDIYAAAIKLGDANARALADGPTFDHILSMLNSAASGSDTGWAAFLAAFKLYYGTNPKKQTTIVSGT